MNMDEFGADNGEVHLNYLVGIFLMTILAAFDTDKKGSVNATISHYCYMYNYNS